MHFMQFVDQTTVSRLFISSLSFCTPSSMQSTVPRESTDYAPHAAPPPPPSKDKASKKHSTVSVTSATASLMGKGKDKRSSATPGEPIIEQRISQPRANPLNK